MIASCRKLFPLKISSFLKKLIEITGLLSILQFSFETVFLFETQDISAFWIYRFAELLAPMLKHSAHLQQVLRFFICFPREMFQSHKNTKNNKTTSTTMSCVYVSRLMYMTTYTDNEYLALLSIAILFFNVNYEHSMIIMLTGNTEMLFDHNTIMSFILFFMKDSINFFHFPLYKYCMLHISFHYISFYLKIIRI